MKLGTFAKYSLNICRTPHGVRGLKSNNTIFVFPTPGRTPHGVRGLKYGTRHPWATAGRVAPLTGCVD